MSANHVRGTHHETTDARGSGSGGAAPGEDPMPDLGPVARQVERLLDGVAEEHLDDPTPCEEYAVRDLLQHLLGLTAAFRDAARKELGPTTGTAPDDAAPQPLAEDWRSRLPRLLGELVAAWRSPAAWQGTTQAGGVTLSGAEAGRVALNELLLHGWDLARATGQDFPCDTDSLRVSEALLAPSAGEQDRVIFAPAVETPPDAPLLDRVVALSGRHPDWTAVAG